MRVVLFIVGGLLIVWTVIKLLSEGEKRWKTFGFGLAIVGSDFIIYAGKVTWQSIIGLVLFFAGIIFLIIGIIKGIINLLRPSRPIVPDEEITKRFKEAAEKGIAPKDVVGFKEIEENRNDSIKKSDFYTVVKEICMVLAKNGYKLSSLVSIGFDKQTYNSAAFYVYSNEGNNIGTIMLNTNVKYSSGMEENGLNNYLEKRDKFYRVQSFPNLEIQSRVSPPQDIPEWLMVCANVLKTYSPGAVDPEWVKKYPEAKKYINTMF